MCVLQGSKFNKNKLYVLSSQYAEVLRHEKIMLRCARTLLNPVLAPESEILFFARPKKSIQKKGRPTAAKALALLTFVEGCLKGYPYPSGNERNPFHSPFGLFPTKAPVLSAAERDKKART